MRLPRLLPDVGLTEARKTAREAQKDRISLPDPQDRLRVLETTGRPLTNASEDIMLAPWAGAAGVAQAFVDAGWASQS